MPKLLWDFASASVHDFFNDPLVKNELCRVIATKCGSSGSTGGGITSVFGRSTPAITAQSGDYTFSQIGSTPTTIAGYGITDALTGAASSTDNAICRFDGITGKVIQNSNVTIDDTTGNFNVPNNWTIASPGPSLRLGNAGFTATAPAIAISTPAFTFNTNTQSQSSSILNNIVFNIEYEQTGTAGSNDLVIMRRDYSLGSGQHNFLKLQGGFNGSDTLFRINNEGSIIATPLVGTGTRLMIANASGQHGTLANGTNGQTLVINAGAPTWVTPSAQTFAGTATTSDATPTTINTIPASVPGAYSFQARAVAFDATGGEAAYINIAALLTSSGGILTMVGEPAYIFTSITTGGLAAADLTVSTSGTNILIWVTGESGISLTWKSLITLIAT